MQCVLCGTWEDTKSEYVGPDGILYPICESCYNSNPPKIICLCGSTRFFQEFADINLRETLNGHIVLSIGCDTHHVDAQYTERQKHELDRLHKYKILMADEIIVINKDGYIGESTKHEIEFAELWHKKISYEYLLTAI